MTVPFPAVPGSYSNPQLEEQQRQTAALTAIADSLQRIEQLLQPKAIGVNQYVNVTADNPNLLALIKRATASEADLDTEAYL